jgi:hypothetical protein
MSTAENRNRHDFRNHLGIILGFSEMLLADAAADDPRRSDFEEIHKAVTAALDLLERLYPREADTSEGFQ